MKPEHQPEIKGNIMLPFQPKRFLFSVSYINTWCWRLISSKLSHSILPGKKPATSSSTSSPPNRSIDLRCQEHFAKQTALITDLRSQKLWFQIILLLLLWLCSCFLFSGKSTQAQVWANYTDQRNRWETPPKWWFRIREFSQNVLNSDLGNCTLPKTYIAPENWPGPKRK